MGFDWYHESCPHGLPAGHCAEHPRALPHQRPPVGDWKVWVLYGGRGSGKTRAASGYILDQVLNHPIKTFLIVGANLRSVKVNMMGGDSGVIMASTDPVRFVPFQMAMRWDNGSLGGIFHSEDPDSLRGFHADVVWAGDPELWSHSEETWRNIKSCLRQPGSRMVVTGGKGLPDHLRGILRGIPEGEFERTVRFTEARLGT